MSFVNAGVRTAYGAYINIVLPGVEVVEDWDAAAIDRLQRTSHTGAVAPLMLDQRGTNPSPAIAGLKYSIVEPRRMRRTKNRSADQFPMRIDGPTSNCGFFRRQDLFDLGGWNEHLPCTLADIDLAIRLRSRRLGSVCDPASCVVLRNDLVGQMGTTGCSLRDSEELFWTHAARVGTKAWLGYAASWVHAAKIPGRLGGVGRRQSHWSVDDFFRSTDSMLCAPVQQMRKAA